jgi:hypothetical protein
VYLHRCIFFSFSFFNMLLYTILFFLSFSLSPETCTILLCVCVCLFVSLYIFSHTCVAVLYVRVSVHLTIYERKQLHSHVNRIIYTGTCITFFSSSSFFLSSSFISLLYLFFCCLCLLFFSLSFKHIHITTKKSLQQK